MPRILVGGVTQTIRAVLVWGGCLDLDGSSHGGRHYCQGCLQLFVHGDTSWSTRVKKICWCRLIGFARDRIHQVGGFEELVVSAIEGLKQVRVVDSLCLVAREQRSGPRDWRDRSRRLCRPRLDLGFSRSCGCEAVATSGPSNLADGERWGLQPRPRKLERWPSCSSGELCAHPLPGAPLSTKASRQSTLGYTYGSSLSVDGAQATNLMVTQDTDKVFIQVRPPCGRNTYVLCLIVLLCWVEMIWVI